MKLVSRWTCSLVFLSLLSTSLADPLRPEDTEALIEQLQSLKNESAELAKKRLNLAVSDFQQAMSSEDGVTELYLKCVEKLDFGERKSQDFRDWKRKHEDMLKKDSFRLALRCQLQWLILCLRADQAKEERNQLAPQLSEILIQIFRNSDSIRGQRELLEKPVNHSVFFRAYELRPIKIEGWPMSPLSLDVAYDQVILPPMRQTGKAESLRQAWNTRILQEAKLIELSSPEPNSDRVGMKNTEQPRTPAMERFAQEQLPVLRWQMEKELFIAGDQRTAAINLMKIIEENAHHAKRNEWITEFEKLIRSNHVLSQ